VAGGIRKHTGTGNAGAGLEENSEINVVPFIDIMLVLLIIFMVAAPLATVEVEVDLPESTAPRQQPPKDPLYLTLRANLSVHVNEEPVARERLAAALDSRTGGDKQTRVFLRADRTVDYEQLMTLMNLLRDAGYLKIALVGLEHSPPPAATAEPAFAEHY